MIYQTLGYLLEKSKRKRFSFVPMTVVKTYYAHFLKQNKQDTMSDLKRLIQNG